MLHLNADVKQAKGGYYSAYYNYMGTVKFAFEQIENALTDKKALDAVFSEQSTSLKKSQYLYQMAQSQYNNGAISYANTLWNQLDQDEALILLNHTKMQQMNNMVNLYQVLGGGYNSPKHLSQIKKMSNNNDKKIKK